MGVPRARTPREKPMMPHAFSDLRAAPQVIKPSKGGYLQDLPGLRPTKKQDKMIKMLFAKYFSVSDYQLATAIGVNRDNAQNDDAYTNTANQLTGVWKYIRRRTFGKNSYLSQLVEHVVEEYDFEATLFNISCEERRLRDPPRGGETEAEKAIREQEHRAYSNAKDDHISRMTTAKAASVATATAELDQIRNRAGRPATSAKIEEVERKLRHYQALERKWTPFVADHFSAGGVLPPHQLMYAYLTFGSQQEIWEELWSLDIGANMLWGVRNAIDVPATLTASEDMYATAFIVYCMDTWKWCLGEEYENILANRALRAAGIHDLVSNLDGEDYRPQVYANLGAVSETLFPTDDRTHGLDTLRIAK